MLQTKIYPSAPADVPRLAGSFLFFPPSACWVPQRYRWMQLVFVCSFFFFHFISIFPLPVPPPFCTIVRSGPGVRACGQSTPSPTPSARTHNTCGPAPLCLLCPLIYQAADDQSLLSSPSALHFALSRPLCHYTNSRPPYAVP